MEKLAFALITATRKLRLYFQGTRHYGPDGQTSVEDNEQFGDG